MRLMPLLGALLLFPGGHVARAQSLPDDEIHAVLHTYADTFGVDVLYPSVAVTHHLSPTLSMNVHYQVDAITSASMRSRVPVDGITSATHRTHGGPEGRFDEVRQEGGAGVATTFGASTVSCDVIYSNEPDYTSFTIIPSGSVAFARRNTEISLSVTQSWDEVSPVIREWSRDKNVLSFETALTQTIGPRAIAQLDFYHSTAKGFLSDPYQVVTIVDDESFDATTYEPRHPDLRIRRALGIRANVALTDASALQLGWRAYWDSWDVRSDTVHGLLYHHLFGRQMTLGAGVRSYVQTSAAFFAPVYTAPQRYMTVDSRLDSSHALEYQASIHLEGRLVDWIPGVDGDRAAIDARATYYHRRTVNPNWHSRLRTLDALTTSVGVRYRFR